MRAASSSLVALLNGGTKFMMADLYTVTLIGGTVLRYSAASTAIVANGLTFDLGPRFERSKTRLVIGTQTDELAVTLYPGADDLIGGIAFLEALWKGALDGALLQLDRAFMPSWGDTSAGTIVLFSGRVSDIQLGRSAAQLTVRSPLELLNTQMPRRLWQSSCTHTLYDPMCGVSRDGVAGGITAAAGSTQGIVVPVLGFDAAGYILGTLTGADGANAGASRTIRTVGPGGALYLARPLLSPVSAGDGFTLHPGCDRTRATCGGRFGNLARFGGFPYVPTPETAA